ncbi:MAG: hypothetical protein LBL31_05545 [Spirochaetaceae bacterium]|nr:hypothetical protein [Spirochaetaceae bacterium]
MNTRIFIQTGELRCGVLFILAVAVRITGPGRGTFGKVPGIAERGTVCGQPGNAL